MPRIKENIERDINITIEILNGKTLKDVGFTHKISQERVRQVSMKKINYLISYLISKNYNSYIPIITSIEEARINKSILLSVINKI